MDYHDIAVIGAGPGGMRLPSKRRRWEKDLHYRVHLSWRYCLNVGCIPPRLDQNGQCAGYRKACRRLRRGRRGSLRTEGGYGKAAEAQAEGGFYLVGGVRGLLRRNKVGHSGGTASLRTRIL